MRRLCGESDDVAIVKKNFFLSRALEHALQHLRLRVSGLHVLPPFGPNMICKYRPGTDGKLNSEASRKSSRRIRTRKISSDNMKPFQCQKCGRGFTLKRNKDRHVNYECGHEPRFQCPYCGLRSKQTSPVYAHIRKKHPEEEVFIFDMKLWARHEDRACFPFHAWSQTTRRNFVFPLGSFSTAIFVYRYWRPVFLNIVYYRHIFIRSNLSFFVIMLIFFKYIICLYEIRLR